MDSEKSLNSFGIEKNRIGYQIIYWKIIIIINFLCKINIFDIFNRFDVFQIFFLNRLALEF